MAWVGTQTVTRPHPGLIVIETDTLDANGEVGNVIDLTDYFKGEQLPSVFNTIATSVSGTVAAIDISLQGSPDNTNWEDITAVTAALAFGWNIVDYTSAVGIRKKKYRYVRHIGVDVASGTKTAKSYLYVE